jgi:hypothetical protein
MSDDPPSERLGLRGTLDLISSAFRTAGTANATGAITGGASYRFFSDKPDLQWAIKYITLVFLFGVATFAVSYIMLLLATIEVDQSLARSSEQNEWEKILWAQPQKTAAVWQVCSASLLNCHSFWWVIGAVFSGRIGLGDAGNSLPLSVAL